MVVNQTVLARRTSQWYETDPVYVRFPLGEHGPFFRVDTANFVQDIKRRPLRVNRKAVMYIRTSEFLKFAAQNRKKLTVKKSVVKSFLQRHKMEIEIDWQNRLLGDILLFFKRSCHEKLRQIYNFVSGGRWLGFVEPKNFRHANSLYYIAFKKREGQPLYLFRIFIEVPRKSNLNAGFWFGKVKHGKSWQGRLNNHAIKCISKIEEVEVKNVWPYSPA